MNQQKQNEHIKLTGLPLPIPLIVSYNGNDPVIWLRKMCSEKELIKQLIECALNELPIVIVPTFTNKFRSIGSLKEKGIIYEKEGEYFFTF